jgi:hypothetical protein
MVEEAPHRACKGGEGPSEGTERKGMQGGGTPCLVGQGSPTCTPAHENFVDSG